MSSIISDPTYQKIKEYVLEYPGGTNNHDERTEAIIQAQTGIRYCRTVDSTYAFDLPADLYA